jgi:cyclic pyranopterin phosphate synthase
VQGAHHRVPPLGIDSTPRTAENKEGDSPQRKERRRFTAEITESAEKKAEKTNKEREREKGKGWPALVLFSHSVYSLFFSVFFSALSVISAVNHSSSDPLAVNLMSELSHFDEQGRSRMVDTSGKPETLREARASGRVRMAVETLQRIRDRGLEKGDVLEVARLAGIMAAKRTGDLIPLCHPLPISSASVDFSFLAPDLLGIEATVRVFGRTGVEMEALTAVSVAALTVYDMCKAIDRVMSVEQIRLEEKSGGRSGTFRRAD